ncbi:MAG: family 16 glycoside hydrolase [Vicinamibacterales bacterium]
MNRGIITYKGQVVQLIQGRRARVIGCVGDGYALRGVMNPNDWNQVHIIARGGVLIHMLNGHVMTISLDEDPTIRKDKGLIAVQIEGNPSEGPLTASFRNIWLRTW